MAGCAADRPGARTAELDGIEHLPSGETEHLEAAGVAGCGEHERVLAIDGERANSIDGWPGVERHLIGGRVHYMGVVEVAACVARQVYLGAVQRDDRVVAVGSCLDRAYDFTVAGIKDGMIAL